MYVGNVAYLLSFDESTSGEERGDRRSTPKSRTDDSIEVVVPLSYYSTFASCYSSTFFSYFSSSLFFVISRSLPLFSFRESLIKMPKFC